MSKDPNLKAIKKVSDNTAIREFDRFIVKNANPLDIWIKWPSGE